MAEPIVSRTAEHAMRVPRAAGPVPPVQAAVDSVGLLHGQREVLIRHGDEVYRLRHTRNDKLILTK